MKSVALTDKASFRPWFEAGVTGARRWAWPLLATASVGYLAGLAASAVSILADQAMSPVRHALASDISVALPPLIRSGSGSAIEVRVRQANGRRVTVSLGSAFITGSTLTAISPLPSTSKSGPDGIELDFETRDDSDLLVVISSTPEIVGRVAYDLGVLVGSDVSATTPMSQYVLPW